MKNCMEPDSPFLMKTWNRFFFAGWFWHVGSARKLHTMNRTVHLIILHVLNMLYSVTAPFTMGFLHRGWPVSNGDRWKGSETS